MYRAAYIDQAIEIGNGTAFKLGSNASTNHAAEQERFVDDIEAWPGLHQRDDVYTVIDEANPLTIDSLTAPGRRSTRRPDPART
jgi:hypothetical protein